MAVGGENNCAASLIFLLFNPIWTDVQWSSVQWSGVQWSGVQWSSVHLFQHLLFVCSALLDGWQLLIFFFFFL
jgi:hypothetical protein